MSTATLTHTKRKIIDLNEDTFKTLSIMAIQKLSRQCISAYKQHQYIS